MAEYVGLDVGKDTTAICVKDEGGRTLAQATAETCPNAIFEALRAHCDCLERIVCQRCRSVGRAGAHWVLHRRRCQGLKNYPAT
jgi:hypothetical protein